MDVYRSIFEASPLAMWTYDRDTLRFIAVNDAAALLYGYSQAELVAMTVDDIRVDSPTPDLWRHRRKDGTVITVEVHARDLVLEGRPVRLVVINDTNERDRAAHERQKLAAISTLASRIAHDFRNVLTATESYASMIEESSEPSDIQHNDAAEIRRASERATAITSQLLTLAGRGDVAPSSLDLDEVIHAFTPMLSRLVGEHITLVTPRHAVPLVLADRGHIEQCLMNLAVNARDAMPDGGRLTMEATPVALETAAHGIPAGPYVVVAVSDRGTGMSAEIRQRLFEPFFTTKKAAGLGLATVHGMIVRAGGAIAVHSELGRGTTFRLYLPVHAETVAAAPVTELIGPRTLPALTVLVVDDDRDVRGVASRILRDAGCTVIEVGSAAEALRSCVGYEGTIDVAVVDDGLADARGERLIEQLHDLRPQLRTVLMSGYPGNDRLSKPFSPAVLRGAVAKVVGAPIAESRRKSEPSMQPRALIADDDASVRRTLARILRRAGLDVVEVDSGAAALVQLEMKRFEVVVSDVNMEGGTGVDVLRGVRRFDLDVPVILMTGNPDLDAAVAAVEHGAFRFLTKPFENEAFLQIVKHAVRANALAHVRREAFSITGGTSARAIDRAGLEVRFESALERLWIAYQPIVDAKTGAVFAVEALMRSDEASVATPAMMLDVATQLNGRQQLGRRVRRVATAGFVSQPEHLVLFVNLHPEDLLDADLIDETAPLTQIASRVVLEITERASLTSSPELTTRLERIRSLGFRLAIDDIGAGYSGLTTFAQLQPELVKIDMSLVRDVHHSPLKQRTIAALIRLCHESGAQVVGEGVETIAERECLVELGCDLLQGFLLAKPERLS